MTDVLGLVAQVRGLVGAAAEDGRLRRWRGALGEIHEQLMRARVSGDSTPPAALAEVGAVLRQAPAKALATLPVRERIALELLRRGSAAPAWLLVWDNASGRVKPSREVATWAGRSTLRTPLPVPVHVESDRTYAWLPGFRDPRWPVPDEVYEVTVTAEVLLDFAAFDGEVLRLYGTASLTMMPTSADDRVDLRLRGPGGELVEVPAVRERRPDLDLPRGVERDRLGWSGWTASVPLTGLAPGTWTVSMGVGCAGALRRAPLGEQRGVLAAIGLVAGQIEVGGSVIRLSEASGRHKGQLQLHVRRLPWRTRVIPRQVRDRLRGR